MHIWTYLCLFLDDFLNDSRTACRSRSAGPGPRIVLSCRNKSLEELPIISKRRDSSTSLKKANDAKLIEKTKAAKTPKPGRKPMGGAGEADRREEDLTEYLGTGGNILYPRLIKDEIIRCDKELLKAAKKAGTIGGEGPRLSE